ncbi:MAG: sugar phosphate isomerase/epimerase [Balneolales bacterium]
MNDKTNSRRNFLKSAAIGLIGGTLGLPKASGAVTESNTPLSTISGPLKLGVATYSLRNFSRPEAINMIREIGARYVNIKSFHLPEDGTRDELAAGRKDFEEAGLEITGGGVITLREDNDEHIRARFEYARNSGLPVMVIAPTPQTLPRIEKFVKAYDIKVAIHNHGPEDRYFPSPQDALKHIRDMDPRVGICNDLGHTVRTGQDLMESLVASGERLYDVHLKDLRDLSDKDSQCVIGEGSMPVADIFYQLAQMNYQGAVSLEYEIEADHPLPGMKQSFSYMRGINDGLNKAMRI